MSGWRPDDTGVVAHDGMELDRAGVIAAGDVLLARAFEFNLLNSANRDDLSKDTLRDYDGLAAQVVAAYLTAANRDAR